MAFPKTWSAPEYMKALRDNLIARPDLAGVQICAAPIGGDEYEMEAVAFIDVTTLEDSAALGDRRREEVYRVEGVVEVHAPGAGDDAADTARDRAAEILGEIELQVRTGDFSQGLNTGGEQRIRYAGIVRKDLRQRIRDTYRRAIIEFDIEVTTRI